ncbi:MAG: permease-like cell division protein FtsX [Gammaproteobacteria bacterium]
MRPWLNHHVRIGQQSLGRITANPIAAWMTITVIAIALALPASLYLLADNLLKLGDYWDGDTSISLYMKPGSNSTATQTLAKQLEHRADILSVNIISSAQALEELQQQSSLSAALDILDENPLPDVIVVKPQITSDDPLVLNKLLNWLNSLPELDMTQLDRDWVERFNAILNLSRTGIFLFAALLGLGVLLVIGNTIRLEIQNRKDEIEITWLVGGTTGFIRRPFLYSGFWYGLLGGLLAWILVGLVWLLLKTPVRDLSSTYQSTFSLSPLSVSASLSIITVSAILGLAGAWLAASYHLYRNTDLNQYY